MIGQIIQQPLPEEARRVEQECRERLEALRREFEAKAEPYVRMLLDLERFRPAPMIILPVDAVPDWVRQHPTDPLPDEP